MLGSKQFCRFSALNGYTPKKKEITMELKPCLSCNRKDQNKNNPVCRDCDKRIEYVNHLEMKLDCTFCYGESGTTAAVTPRSFLSKGVTLDG